MLTSRLLILNQKEAECRWQLISRTVVTVIWCTEYDEATEILSRGKNKPDLLIFDVDHRRDENMRRLKKIRSLSDMAVLMLSQDDKLDSQLYAYSKKIDDYMVKPAPLLEAHVEAVIRRTAEKRNPVESVGALSIDYEGRKIYLADKVLKVTAKEFDLLEYFVKHKGMILSRDKILDSVWGFDYIGGYRSVDTLVKKLRAKLTKEYPYIKTVYGVGYCFDV